jgi:hypothetical protein
MANSLLANRLTYHCSVLSLKHCPTQRALDAGDSAAFSSIFLASSFFCSQAESRPAHLRLTQAVSLPLAQQCTTTKYLQGDKTNGKPARSTI